MNIKSSSYIKKECCFLIKIKYNILDELQLQLNKLNEDKLLQESRLHELKLESETVVIERLNYKTTFYNNILNSTIKEIQQDYFIRQLEQFTNKLSTISTEMEQIEEILLRIQTTIEQTKYKIQHMYKKIEKLNYINQRQ